MYLLGQGKINEVMMVPILQKEFPEFWKVFICWRKDIASWRENSLLIESKNQDNKAYMISAKLWQGLISPAEAESLISDISYEERPLLFFMIAERYRKDGNRIKSSIFYQAAIKFKPPNIYKHVAEYFKDN